MVGKPKADFIVLKSYEDLSDDNLKRINDEAAFQTRFGWGVHYEHISVVPGAIVRLLRDAPDAVIPLFGSDGAHMKGISNHHVEGELIHSITSTHLFNHIKINNDTHIIL